MPRERPISGVDPCVPGAGFVSRQPLGQQVQAVIAAALRFEFLYRCNHILAVRSGMPVCLANEMKLRVVIETAGVLRMTMVGDIDESPDPALASVKQHDLAGGFPIHVGDLLTLAQIGHCLSPNRPVDAVGDPAAGSAAVEPKNEPRLFRRAAMDERIDAQGAMQPGEAGRYALAIGKSRPPHQRAIAENPEVLVGMIEDGVHIGSYKGPAGIAGNSGSRNSPVGPVQA